MLAASHSVLLLLFSCSLVTHFYKIPFEIWPPKNIKILAWFRTAARLDADISGKQQDIVSRKMALQTMDASAQANLIRCASVHKWQKNRIGVLSHPTGTHCHAYSKGKGPVLDITLLHDECMLIAQECFTISEVAADWHELMIPQHIIRPSIAHASEQLDPRCSMPTCHRPNQLH